MARKSKIEWTDSTWNPVTGCDKISDGCVHCYAERLANRLRAMRNPRYAEAFGLTVHHDLIDAPLHWRQPRMIFVNSMSDLFHEDIPPSVVERVFHTMNKASHHTFQILTKRSAQLLKYADRLTWTPNIWMGVTVEADRYVDRMAALSQVPAAVRFVSFEPLLTDFPETTDLTHVDWAIVGGESGPGARPMLPEWVLSIQKICRRDDVAFFFKQWGGTNKKRNGRVFAGQTWDAMPVPSAQRTAQSTLAV